MQVDRRRAGRGINGLPVQALTATDLKHTGLVGLNRRMPLFHTDSITLPDQSAAGSGTVDLTVFPFEVVRRAVGSLLGFLHDGLQSGWDLNRYDRVGRTLAAAAASRRRGLVARVLDRMLTACGPLPLDEVIAGLARATRYAPASTCSAPAGTLLAYLA